MPKKKLSKEEMKKVSGGKGGRFVKPTKTKQESVFDCSKCPFVGKVDMNILENQKDEKAIHFD